MTIIYKNLDSKLANLLENLDQLASMKNPDGTLTDSEISALDEQLNANVCSSESTVTDEVCQDTCLSDFLTKNELTPKITHDLSEFTRKILSHVERGGTTTNTGIEIEPGFYPGWCAEEDGSFVNKAMGMRIEGGEGLHIAEKDGVLQIEGNEISVLMPSGTLSTIQEGKLAIWPDGEFIINGSVLLCYKTKVNATPCQGEVTLEGKPGIDYSLVFRDGDYPNLSSPISPVAISTSQGTFTLESGEVSFMDNGRFYFFAGTSFTLPDLISGDPLSFTSIQSADKEILFSFEDIQDGSATTIASIRPDPEKDWNYLKISPKGALEIKTQNTTVGAFYCDDREGSRVTIHQMTTDEKGQMTTAATIGLPLLIHETPSTETNPRTDYTWRVSNIDGIKDKATEGDFYLPFSGQPILIDTGKFVAAFELKPEGKGVTFMPQNGIFSDYDTDDVARGFPSRDFKEGNLNLSKHGTIFLEHQEIKARSDLLNQRRPLTADSLRYLELRGNGPAIAKELERIHDEDLVTCRPDGIQLYYHLMRVYGHLTGNAYIFPDPYNDGVEGVLGVRIAEAMAPDDHEEQISLLYQMGYKDADIFDLCLAWGDFDFAESYIYEHDKNGFPVLDGNGKPVVIESLKARLDEARGNYDDAITFYENRGDKGDLDKLAALKLKKDKNNVREYISLKIEAAENGMAAVDAASSMKEALKEAVKAYYPEGDGTSYGNLAEEDINGLIGRIGAEEAVKIFNMHTVSPEILKKTFLLYKGLAEQASGRDRRDSYLAEAFRAITYAAYRTDSGERETATSEAATLLERMKSLSGFNTYWSIEDMEKMLQALRDGKNPMDEIQGDGGPSLVR